MQPLKITVVTVSYNAAATIEETIRSVVDQTYDNVEYIIIDGGSIDGTVDIVRKYAEGGSEASNHRHKITYWVSEPDRGIYDAMNKGIAAATGDYINFMNAGDRFVNNNVVNRVIEEISESDDIITGDYYLIDLKKSKNPEYRKPEVISKVISKDPLCHQATFSNLRYHKEHVFDTSYKIVADWNFFRKAYLSGNVNFKTVDFPICYFDCTYGMSHDNLDLLYRERYRCLGIDKSFIKKLPHEVIRLLVHIKNLL